MRISDELRNELRQRYIELRKHAEYCDGRVVELLEEAADFKGCAVKDRDKAQELQDILDASEGGPKWNPARITIRH